MFLTRASHQKRLRSRSPLRGLGVRVRVTVWGTALFARPSRLTIRARSPGGRPRPRNSSPGTCTPDSELSCRRGASRWPRRRCRCQRMDGKKPASRFSPVAFLKEGRGVPATARAPARLSQLPAEVPALPRASASMRRRRRQPPVRIQPRAERAAEERGRAGGDERDGKQGLINGGGRARRRRDRSRGLAASSEEAHADVESVIAREGRGRGALEREAHTKARGDRASQRAKREDGARARARAAHEP